jgi:CBS domain-containing protein
MKAFSITASAPLEHPRGAAPSDSVVYSTMKAFNVMNPNVVSVDPDVSINQIARVLVENGISAVPVVDESGAPVGMVSEGDLIPRRQVERETRRDWWLDLLAEGEALSPDFLANLKATPSQKATDVMTCPVVTVHPDINVTEIAQLLAKHRIKRVPVVQDGRVVGIVSRADLVRALAEHSHSQQSASPKGFLALALDSLDAHFLATRHPKAATTDAPVRSSERSDDHLDAADFRRVVAGFEQQERQTHLDQKRAAAERLRNKVTELLAQHVSDEQWHDLLRKAHDAAEHGRKEFLLLRFPSQLCSDGGRCVNVSDPNWPATLGGEAAEVYMRWKRDLKPHGFGLAAQILEFPDGIPGDAGLFLIWGTS